MSVVLPEDSGPNTSTMRPRGTPPMPSARSSESAPVGIAATRTWAPSSPMRMTVPLPNSRSICVSAPWSAAARAFAAFSSSVVTLIAPLLVTVVRGSHRTRRRGRNSPGRGRTGGRRERLVARAVRVERRAEQRRRDRREAQRRRRRQLARALAAGAHARDRDVRPEALAPGSQPSAAASVATSASRSARSAPSGSPTSTASTRGRRGGSHAGAPDGKLVDRGQQLRARPERAAIGATAAGGCSPRKQSVRCSASGIEAARLLAAADRGARPVRELVADVLAAARRRRTAASRAGYAAAARSLAPSSRRRSRCIAAVVVRSRTSARVPRWSVRRTIRAAVGGGQRDPDEADRLLRRAAVRARRCR